MQVRPSHLTKWIIEGRKKYRTLKKLTGATYMTKLRKEMGVSSRAISRKLSATARDQETIGNDAIAVTLELNDEFVELDLSDSQVPDQSNFEYEAMRTLAFEGERLVKAIVTDANVVTHSYLLPGEDRDNF